jgi:hypothetical protein
LPGPATDTHPLTIASLRGLWLCATMPDLFLRFSMDKFFLGLA